MGVLLVRPDSEGGLTVFLLHVDDFRGQPMARYQRKEIEVETACSRASHFR